MLHDLVVTWFEWARQGGYPGIFLMMALESTIVPIPSEIIIPPAAYWAAQGGLSPVGVVLAGALGSTFGSSATYAFTRYAGRAFVERYGRYFLLGPDKLALAERWLEDFALPGVFFARLLPVLRHLIGFPAGLLRVPFAWFAVVTFVGSGLWCSVLALVGMKTIGARPDLLQDPNALREVIGSNLGWFVGLVLIVGVGFGIVRWYGRRIRATH